MTEVVHNMKQFSAKNVQDNFEQVIDDVFLSGEPVKITSDAGNATLVYEEIWDGMTETLNLLPAPKSNLKALGRVAPTTLPTIAHIPHKNSLPKLY